MKRLILTIVLLFSLLPLFSYTNFYMAPFGSNNFNLDNPGWSEVITVPNDEQDGEGSNNFESNRIVILGGIDELETEFFSLDSEVATTKINLSFSSSSGSSLSANGTYFWFTKQSDPEFRRPFQIQIVSRLVKKRKRLLPGYAYTHIDTDRKLMGENGSQNQTLEVLPSGWDSLVNFFGAGTYFIIFEFGIILPGDIENGILTLDDGSTYPIATGDDYSAEITITAEIEGGNNESADSAKTITFTVPFSGYYDPRLGDGATRDDTSAALYVIPSARAANIDLIHDRGSSIDIASIDFSIFNLSPDFTAGEYDESVFLFLSSSSNPFDAEAGEFRFLQDGVGFGDAITESNSIGYTITVVPSADTVSHDTSGKIKEIEFDGTDYLTADGSHPVEGKRIYTGHYDEKMGQYAGIDKVHWHSYSGDVKLSLEQNHTTLMNAGAYKSTVYVHVVTDDKKLGGTTT